MKRNDIINAHFLIYRFIYIYIMELLFYSPKKIMLMILNMNLFFQFQVV
jgi:hypothetical protein